jgi:hypothetical protein
VFAVLAFVAVCIFTNHRVVIIFENNDELIRSISPYARAADLDQKNPIYHYRHIFVYLYFGCTVAAAERATLKNGKKIPCSHK